jgi:hypothetical protein
MTLRWNVRNKAVLLDSMRVKERGECEMLRVFVTSQKVVRKEDPASDLGGLSYCLRRLALAPWLDDSELASRPATCFPTRVGPEALAGREGFRRPLRDYTEPHLTSPGPPRTHVAPFLITRTNRQRRDCSGSNCITEL